MKTALAAEVGGPEHIAIRMAVEANPDALKIVTAARQLIAEQSDFAWLPPLPSLPSLLSNARGGAVVTLRSPGPREDEWPLGALAKLRALFDTGALDHDAHEDDQPSSQDITAVVRAHFSNEADSFGVTGADGDARSSLDAAQSSSSIGGPLTVYQVLNQGTEFGGLGDFGARANGELPIPDAASVGASAAKLTASAEPSSGAVDQSLELASLEIEESRSWPNPLEILAKGLPFERAALDRAVERFFDQLDDLAAVVPGFDHSAAWVPASLGFAVAISALELHRRKLRRLEKGDSGPDAEADEGISLFGFPGPWLPRFS
jgi:hypothetical protein